MKNILVSQYHNGTIQHYPALSGFNGEDGTCGYRIAAIQHHVGSSTHFIVQPVCKVGMKNILPIMPTI